ncbi:MAG: glycosyltransferase family 4 protein [Acidimicrobiales bacterium]
MHIAMVCPYSLSVPGGVQGQVLGLTRALRDRGHTVQIIAPSDGPLAEGGVTVIGPSVLNASNGSMAPISPNPQAQLRTMRALWDERFDVLHLHEPLVPGPTVTALMLRSAPIVGTFHAAGEQALYKSMSSLARWFGGRIDAKVAVSPDAQALAGIAMPDPWTILFNGVEIEPFATAEPWVDPALPDSVPTVLFVGRHEERKGLGVLLEAVQLIDRDLRVWVAGNGPETEALRARHAGDHRIEWLGRISNEERNRRMAAASVFAAPSLGGESFGVILLEAMAAGAPVVASSISGYAGVAGPIADEPAAALLAEPGDPAAFAMAITQIIGDPALADRLRERGRVRAHRFSMDRLAEAYTVIYEAVIAEALLNA